MIQLKLLSAGFLVLGVCQGNASTYETNFSKIAGYTLGTILVDSGYGATPPDKSDKSDKSDTKKNADGTESDEEGDSDQDTEED